MPTIATTVISSTIVKPRAIRKLLSRSERRILLSIAPPVLLVDGFAVCALLLVDGFAVCALLLVDGFAVCALLLVDGFAVS
jgi:hypothetical protein